ncbi:flavin reductase family protein [Streptomyces sp. H39-S7]|uniref:flavin reductase family protein n=1 Tax=Streptomyces sp. H39-S7 TaxID=3004357 RepID=UPI0022AFEA32|nr:flavin reductase family protein [Streptomyces sp. H39-S7]MCZ4118558.1 flavin reductase family protein [Streptomyces sp. H39-S7]
MAVVMGHAGMAATAVRYLRSVGAATTAEPVEPLPRPDLRAVGPDERAPVDPGMFRKVLGTFASGVTIVTAPGAEGPTGFACQSFASLSLDPPLVAFMVARTSTTWPKIARAGVFCVNILSDEQGALCRGFAVSGADKFAGVDWTPTPVTGSPRLAGIAAWIDCTIHAVHTGGDHLIVVGRVDELGCTEPADADDATPEAGPLLFYRGGFGRFAR